MKIKINKLKEEAIIPTYSRYGDAGLDLTAISMRLDKIEDFFEYGTGLSIEIPVGYVGLLFPRSSISNMNMMLTNSVGVIDSNYRGEIKFRFKRLKRKDSLNDYKIGDRIGQLIILPYPQIQFEEVDELTESNRNEKGFGSSGK